MIQKMKKIIQHKIFGTKWTAILLGMVFLITHQNVHAQYISLNGAYISISSSTNIGADTITNDNTSTLANAGTISIYTINNAGTAQGNGTYNIAAIFANTGTFTPGSSTVNFNGTGAQNIAALTFNNLTISGGGTKKTATGNIVVNATLTVNSTDTLDLVTNTLSGTLSAIAGTGKIKTQNTSSTPVPAGKTWTGKLFYNSSSSQNIVQANYNDLDGTGGNRVLAASRTGIAGTFTVGSGTYTTTGSNIDFNAAGAQTIPAFGFNNITVSGGNTKTLGGNISIIDSLTLGANTTLALSSSDITLKSNASTTARIANTPTTADITYGSGKFIVQRYVIGRRKYRLMTSSVTTSTSTTLSAGEEALSIWGNWQNQGNNTTPNIGTIITGGTAADGFDQQTTNASLYTYDDVNKKYVGYTSANGKNTKYTPLKAGIAYYMFVYGDRTNTVFTSNPKNTTLSERGTVLKGDQAYTTSSTIPLSSVNNRFTILGNPFASPVDWATIPKNDVSNTFWGWDPNLNSTGGYVTVSTTGTVTLIAPFSGTVGLNQYIQPGQGFFVKTTGAAPAITIREQDKVSANNPIAFIVNTVNSIPLIAVNLQYSNAGNMVLLDGTLAAFDPAFSNNVGNEDGTKIFGSTESIGIVKGADTLSIDARKMPLHLDTMFLNVAKLIKPQYTLQIFANQMQSSTLQPILIDNYLNTSQPLLLNDTNRIVFNVTAGVPASSAPNRFKIVFHDLTILPVTFTSISATQKGKEIEVKWSVAEETSTKKYEVERSADGVSFSKQGEVTARGTNGSESYQWMDHRPLTGNNFFRIRSIDADGRYLLSRVVLVKFNGEVNAEPSGIKVYPNPVKNKQVNIQLVNLEKGEYTIQLLNTRGQLISQQVIIHSGGNASHLISLDNNLPAGIYYIKLLNKVSGFTQLIYIE